jgi:hypothetical protein
MNQNKNNNPNDDTTTTERVMWTRMFVDRDSTERAFKTLEDRGYSKTISISSCPMIHANIFEEL